MDVNDCFQLGKITKPFGYKGEVVFFLDVDDPTDYAELDSVFVEIGGKLLPYFIEEINIKGNKAVVRFEDVTAEESGKLVGKNLFLPLSVLPKLTGKKFYFHEIINFAVVDAKKGLSDFKSILRSSEHRTVPADTDDIIASRRLTGIFP